MDHIGGCISLGSLEYCGISPAEPSPSGTHACSRQRVHALERARLEAGQRQRHVAQRAHAGHLQDDDDDDRQDDDHEEELEAPARRPPCLPPWQGRSLTLGRL